MTKEMLINTVEGHECRIAVVEDGVMEELYVERVSSASRVGNIYKGRVTNVEPAIQAAFIDFGLGKNGFLHISDVNPSFFPRGQKMTEAVGRKRAHRDRPPIQECLRRGQEIVVQMTKEGIGTKGPTLTTYLSIPGRLLVMMPGMSRLGVSRKVMDEQARQQARNILQDLSLPADMGFIVRTAGIDRPKRELQRDLNYLTRLWKTIDRRIKSTRAPVEIYQESDLVIRTIRDVYNTDIQRIVCDNADVARHVKEFLDMAMPRSKHVIELYTGKEGLFHDLGLEREIEKVFSRRVDMPSGGWLAFDQAEALVAIDVNSGRFREHTDAEMTATRLNQEAAAEIARQLRLRDMGGVIIIDFVDMRDEKNRRSVERVLREAIKNDRAKTKVLKISALGIVEMTRQRIRPSLRDSVYRRCASCDGAGLIKSEESVSLSVLRTLHRLASMEDIAQIELVMTPAVAQHLQNFQRTQIAQMEAASLKRIIIRGDENLRGDQIVVSCTNNRGSVVPWEQPIGLPAQRAPLQTVPIETVLPAGPAVPPEEGLEGEPLAEEEMEVQPEPGEGEAAVAGEFAGEPKTQGSGMAPDASARVVRDESPEAFFETEDEAAAMDEQEPEGEMVDFDQPAPIEESPSGAISGPRVSPQAPGRPQMPPRPPMPHGGHGQHPAGGPPQPGEPGRRRRRGRRGGRRHRHKGQGLPQQMGQPAQPGQAPMAPSTGRPAPAHPPTQGQSAPAAVPTAPANAGAQMQPPLPAPAPHPGPQQTHATPPVPAQPSRPQPAQGQSGQGQGTQPQPGQGQGRGRHRRRGRGGKGQSQRPPQSQQGPASAQQPASPAAPQTSQPQDAAPQAQTPPPAKTPPAGGVDQGTSSPQASAAGGPEGEAAPKKRRRGRRGGRRHHRKDKGTPGAEGQAQDTPPEQGD